MARTLDTSLIELPRVDAQEALALGKQLLAAADKQKSLPVLPDAVKETRDEVDDACKGLEAELKVGPAVGTPTKKEADRREDAAIVGAHTILVGWAMLAEFLAEGQTAQQLQDRLFPEGVKFVQQRYETEWTIVETKLKTIADESLDTKLAALGMGPVLKFLQDTHQVYGAVLGTTATLEEPAEIGKARTAVLDAIRAHVIQAMAQVKKAKPETQAFADELLLPIKLWKTSKPAKPKASTGPTGATGATGATGPGATGAMGPTGP